MPIILTPNMNLPVPIVGQELGPQYATDVNNSLTQIDAHNHTPGYGVQIPPTGLNINSDLTFINNRATNLKSAQFFVQGSPLAAVSPDLGAVYVSGFDLWYNDTQGNQVRLTAGGSVNSGSGSISGLVSPASASYSSGQSKFIWQSDVNTSAGMDGGPITIRDETASAKGITIQSPVALPNDYSLTLMSALPVSTKFLSVDSSGNVSTSATIQDSDITDATITVDKMAAMPSGTTVGINGLGIAGSCGNFNTTNVFTNYVNVTNQSITITTSGRPVCIEFVTDTTNGGLTNTGYMITTAVSGAYLAIQRDAAIISQTQISQPNFEPPGVLNYIDTDVNGVPGTYTYLLKACVASAGNIQVLNMHMIAYEI